MTREDFMKSKVSILRDAAGKLFALTALCLIVSACFGQQHVQTIQPATIPREPVLALSSQPETQAQDEQVYTVAYSKNTSLLDTSATIVEGAVEVQFVKNDSGDIVCLPSGRPMIKNEDVMLNLARVNLQENFARFMKGTVAQGVSVDVAEYLRNYYPEPILKSFQENVSRIAWDHELPKLTEREQVVRGNLLIVRADAGPIVRKIARNYTLLALENALQDGIFDRAASTAAVERALEKVEW